MKHQLIGRVIDVALIFALVYGNTDVRTFCFWVISVLTACIFLGAWTMTTETAKKIQTRPITLKVTRTVMCILYVAALVYSGFPGLAALYGLVSLILYAAAEAKTQAA